MPVFVDTMRARFGRMIMCHMFADTDEELHAMAAKIGVSRRWHQRPPCKAPGMDASWSHYDICMSKKDMARAFGAIEIEYRDLPNWLKQRGRK
jgi:hypothetical protein